MKQRKRLFVIIFGILIAGIIGIGMIYTINKIVTKCKLDDIRQREYQYRNDVLVNLDRYTSLENIEGAWYDKYSVISHSGGQVDGKTYTNSREAWEVSYKNGNRVFDADLNFTSDGILVLRHEWSDDFGQSNISQEKIPTYNEFMETSIHLKYTPMSCYDMITFLNEHTDCYAACDFKNDAVDTFGFLVDAAISMNMENVLDRIIISFYKYEDYERIKEVYQFKNWAIRQYENSPHNYYELAEFCLVNQISVCMVKQQYISEGDNIEVLLDKGIRVWVAVVNDLEDFDVLRQRGVTGCVSDCIYEDDL